MHSKSRNFMLDGSRKDTQFQRFSIVKESTHPGFFASLHSSSNTCSIHYKMKFIQSPIWTRPKLTNSEPILNAAREYPNIRSPSWKRHNIFGAVQSCENVREGGHDFAKPWASSKWINYEIYIFFERHNICSGSFQKRRGRHHQHALVIGRSEQHWKHLCHLRKTWRLFAMRSEKLGKATLAVRTSLKMFENRRIQNTRRELYSLLLMRRELENFGRLWNCGIRIRTRTLFGVFWSSIVRVG